MSKKNNVTLPVEASQKADLSLILAALPGAVKGLATMATAREAAKVKCLAFADTIKATFGTLDVLTATERNKKATDVQKAAYTDLKEAYLAEIWGADFLAWVNDPEGKGQKAPKRGQKAQPRTYWQAQKGAKWNKAGEGFVPKVLAFVAEAEAEAANNGRAANRQTKGLDDACRDNLTAALKRVEKAQKDGAELPVGLNFAAFKVLATLALEALEPGKTKQGRAEQALKALRAAKMTL